MSFSLDKLKVFYTVANKGSFTLAAQDLNISQSALSRCVASLEDQLSCRLLERSIKGLKLTEAGAFWYENASSIMNVIKDTQLESNYSKKKQTLSIAIQTMIEEFLRGFDYNKDKKFLSLINLAIQKEIEPMNISILTLDIYTTNIFTRILRKLVWKYPGLSFSIKDATVDQIPDNVDISLLNFNHPSENFINEKLAEDDLHLYASPAYLERFGCPLSLEDTKNHIIIRPERSDVLASVTKTKYKPIFHKEDCIKVDSLNGLISLGIEGTGIICSHKYALNGVEQKLEKIQDLDDAFIIPMVFSVNKRIKDSFPVIDEIRDELKAFFRATK